MTPVELRVKTGCDSLWKTMNQRKPTPIARKSCWMAKKCRLIFLTQPGRKITLPSETITSAAEKDFFVYSRLQIWNLFSQLLSSGELTAVGC